MIRRFASLILVLALAVPVLAEEAVDLDAMQRIRQEGFRDSKVMEAADELTNGIGARLTGSPAMKKANEWARDKLASWGLSNARLEPWSPFGRGWVWESATLRMVTPETTELLAYPEAWSLGTNGPVRGPAIRLKAETKEELEKYKGQLAGKIVLLGQPREVASRETPDLHRYDAKGLEELARYEIPGTKPPRYNREELLKRREVRRAAMKMLTEEKALAILSPGRFDGGAVGVQAAGSWNTKEPEVMPSLSVASEHYGRVARLLDKGVPVDLEINVVARYLPDVPTQWNTIAEIPGTDKKEEIVLIGAHLDSWHAATGATDNAAGVVACMEAMRILKEAGLRPRRTIRIALWSGEEQGLFGSRGYVKDHYGSWPIAPEDAELPFYRRKKAGPLQLKADHGKLFAYFNMDNGSGKIRGIYAEENAAAIPVFKAWIEPLEDLGVTTVTMNGTSNTDHDSFDEVGLPGFQFIQDGLEYFTRTHHSNMDLYERL
ncbi:MAG TPA: M20/M25/M40 family metallo-hydrolase, partial [Thermoanaerobaculia bacterium]